MYAFTWAHQQRALQTFILAYAGMHGILSLACCARPTCHHLLLRCQHLDPGGCCAQPLSQALLGYTTRRFDVLIVLRTVHLAETACCAGKCEEEEGCEV